MLKFWIILILLSVRLGAATYYVDFVSGNDTNNGTATSTPFQHCPGDTAATSNAVLTLSAGDTVVFRGGVQYDIGSGKVISANASGAAGSPITYTSGHVVNPQWGTTAAVINGTNMTDSVSIYGAVDWSGYSYLVADGLAFKGSSVVRAPYSGCIGGRWDSGGNISILNCTISNSTASGVYIRGNYNNSTPSTFVISNCLIHTIGAHGVFLNYGMTNAQIISNTITNCGVSDDPTLTGDNIGIFGFDSSGANQSLIIRSNNIADAHLKSPVILGNHGNNWIIEQNYFHGNYGFSGFDVGCTYTNLTIRNNVWDVNITNYEGAMCFTANEGFIPSDGIHIYNNTIRGTVLNNGVIRFRSLNYTGTAFYNVFFTNNIVLEQPDSWNVPLINVAKDETETVPVVDVATFKCDYNVYRTNTAPAKPFTWNGVAASWTEWKAAISGDANSIIGSPTFVSATDLHLSASDTVAKDNGANLNALFTVDKDGVTRGSQWDIGAYEYVAPATIAPPFRNRFVPVP